MGLLLKIPSSMDTFVTEVVPGEVASPPGEGWEITAVVEGVLAPRFVWTRSKIFLESEKTEKKGKKK
jgi:hypothetical protein